MASNEVKLTIKVGDDGSLDVVAKKAKQAAKSTDDLGKATDRTNKARKNFNKGEKGVAGATSNSTKAFSKMRESMTGGGGLVPAYATLAANVFALTAAFNALKVADTFRLLEEGLNKVGAAAGRNLPYVADRLKDITGSAVSTRDAMEAVALGTASGFSQEQIEGLAKVARGASTALGRDMTDALSRLTRGAAKLEPEILDELGIMVRLDDATTTYAANLGKTADQLSIVERRQAFTNAILEQGIKKYGGLTDSIEPSAYDQLAASFDELAKSTLNLLNTGLTPLVQILASNKNALTGAAILFGSTISKQMLPALYGSAEAAAESAKSLAMQAEETQGNIKTTGKFPKVYKGLSESIKAGTATQDEYNSALKSLDRSLTLHRGQLVGITKEHGAESTQVQIKKGKIQEVTAARRALLVTMAAQSAASSKLQAANAIEAASALNLKAAYGFVKVAIAEYSAAQLLSAEAAGKTVGIFGLLRKSAFSLSLSIKVLGSAFLAAIPLIGQVVLVGSLLLDYFGDLIFKTDKTREAIDEIVASFNSMGDASEDLQRRLKDTDTPGLEIAKTMSGLYGEVRARYKELIDEIVVGNRSARIDEINDQLAAARTQIKQIEEDTSFHKTYREFMGISESVAEVENRMRRLRRERAELLKQQGDLQVLGPDGLEGTQAILEAFIDQLSSMPNANKEVIHQYQLLLNSLDETTPIEGVKLALEAIGSSTTKTVEGLESAEDAFSKFREGTAKYEKQQQTPFDDIINQAIILKDTLNSVEEDISLEIISTLGESFTGIFGKTREEVAGVVTELQKNQKLLLENPGLIKGMQAELKSLNKVRRESPVALEAALELENKIAEKKQQTYQAEIDLINAVTTKTNKEKERILELERLIGAETSKIVKDEVIKAEVAVSQVREAQKLVKLRQRIASETRKEFESVAKIQRLNQIQENAKDKLRSDISLTAKQEEDIFNKNKKERIKLAKAEQALKIEAINMEYDLLEAQSELLRQRLLAEGLSTASIDNYISKLDSVRDAAIDAQIQAGKAALSEITNTGLNNNINTQNAVLAAAGEGGSTSARFENFSREGGFEKLDSLTEKVQATREILAPMIEDLKSLGPDGILVAAVAEGSMKIAESLSQAFESSATGMEKAAGVAQAIGDTIGAVNSIMQASIQATIAKIDDQIAAEKKRDGKSAESVAKIQALEKKKEQQQRKAFEVNKKMLMAQTVANTAAGIMRAIAEGGLAGIVIGGIIAAMGAAQLAIIAGTSYQGGSSGAPSGPASVSVGQRRNSADLAKSQGGAGELAYFRGARGQGGPENFTPAFAGYKNRAEGGNTAFMVGEQGPELFVPERPGRIVPNDDIQQGTPVNATINISAVDAAGVEDVLMNQRGNIISMIRDAANAQGDAFLENINVAEL